MVRGLALTVLVGVASQTLAYRVPAPYPSARARDVFGKLAELLGHGTRWWTNTDLSSWNPVTRHSMDALVIGAGGGLLLAVLARTKTEPLPTGNHDERRPGTTRAGGRR